MNNIRPPRKRSCFFCYNKYMKKVLILGILVILIVIGFLALKKDRYESSTFGISFEKIDNVYIKENKNGILIVEDTEENRDLLDGKTTVAREGPTSISIEIYANPEYFPNLYLANNGTSTEKINGEEGIGYTWSGLYEGKTIVVTKGNQNYAFSVTWLTKEDKLLKDFEKLIDTADF